MQSNKFFNVSYSFGELLINFLKLQFFWFFFCLRGFLLLGIFPACATVIKSFFYFFEHREFPVYFYQWFLAEYRQNFKQTNQLGFIQLFICGLLWFDLRISERFIQNNFIHFGLILLFVLTLLTAIYLFPTFLRYNLSFLQYFKQAFFLVISSLVESAAIILGVFVAVVIATFFPVLIIAASIPLILFPLSWFSFQAMQKIERNNLVNTQSKEK